MKSTIFIPKKIKVGFNNRTDTYTGKLGYIIYNDGKVWRKETSWESWRDKKIKTNEFDNTPIEGFVLNKKAGGGSTGWNHRQTYCRVYDPRGFEFEISIPNLLYILENATSTKGKGLEGKFIYGWEGKDLILVPEEAPEYKEMVEFTELQDKKVSKKDLILGGIYLDSAMNKVTYLETNYEYSYNGVQSKDKKLWFHDPNYYGGAKTKDISSIKSYTEEINPEYTDLLDKLEKNTYYKPKVEKETKYIALDISALDKISSWEAIYYKDGEKFKRCYTYKDYDWKGNKTEYTYYLDSKRPKGYNKKNLDHIGKFSSMKELIQKYPIYQQTIVKKDG